MEHINEQQESMYKYLYQIPTNKGRLISLVIQTTSLSIDSNIIEIGCREIINGKITSESFQIQIKPRYYMNDETINYLTFQGRGTFYLSIHILAFGPLFKKSSKVY